jgi:hypothetical protein
MWTKFKKFSILRYIIRKTIISEKKRGTKLVRGLSPKIQDEWSP